jgi:two-component system KDP operon response regulator KdpE
LIEVDDRLKIDFDRREVWVDGNLVQLRPTEYRLLLPGAKRRLGDYHDQLLAKVWGYEYQDEPHSCGFPSTTFARKSKRIR